MSPLLNPDALEDLVDAGQRVTRDTARDIADAGVDRLERNVQRRTPIDTNPFRYRPERPRGTLRRSVHRAPGLRLVLRGNRERWEGEVLTYDLIAPHVEFDTLPHKIRPRAPGGRLVFQSRDGWTDRDGVFHPPGTWVSVEEVDHPGTQGQHMFKLGAMDTEAELLEFAAPEIRRWARRLEGVRV